MVSCTLNLDNIIYVILKWDTNVSHAIFDIWDTFDMQMGIEVCYWYDEGCVDKLYHREGTTQVTCWGPYRTAQS